MLRFIGDTASLLLLIVYAVISLGLNLAILTLTLAIKIIEAYVGVFTTILGAYGARAAQILNRADVPTRKPEDTVH